MIAFSRAGDSITSAFLSSDSVNSGGTVLKGRRAIKAVCTRFAFEYEINLVASLVKRSAILLRLNIDTDLLPLF